MQIDREFTADDRAAINPSNSISINQAIDFVKNPVQCCKHVQQLIQTLLAIVNVKRDDPKTRDAILYHGETWDLMGRRWGKIEKDFATKNSAFDISKIPDIYDCIKYDLQHNQHTLQYEQAEELYIYARYLADIVIPQEYGLTIQEKLTIGQGICTPLLKKVKADLQRNIEEVGNESVNRLNPRYSHGVSSPGRHVRTRLYFTSESHVHSLLTVLRFGGLLDVLTDEQWRRAMEYVSMVSELNYMSQIVIMLYEDPTKDPSSEERFHVELHFSPGVNCCVQKNLPPGPGFRPHSRNDSVTSKNTVREKGEKELSFVFLMCFVVVAILEWRRGRHSHAHRRGGRHVSRRRRFAQQFRTRLEQRSGHSGLTQNDQSHASPLEDVATHSDRRPSHRFRSRSHGPGQTAQRGAGRPAGSTARQRIAGRPSDRPAPKSAQRTAGSFAGTASGSWHSQ